MSQTTDGWCPRGMTIRIQQVIGGVLALSAAFIGTWALLAPRSFFDDFPFSGRHWVSLAGAYDEHLIRDVGAFYLALLAVTVWAVVRAGTELLRLTGVAWLVFSIPHLLFHAGHLEDFPTGDKVGQMVSLGGTVALAAVLLLPARDTKE